MESENREKESKEFENLLTKFEKLTPIEKQILLASADGMATGFLIAKEQERKKVSA